MNAINKSWLMVGGLALVVGGAIFATRRMGGIPAPTAEIAPVHVTHAPSKLAPTRTQVPTILRAKPVTEAEPAASPRYAPHNATKPGETPLANPPAAGNFRPPSAGIYPQPAGLPQARAFEASAPDPLKAATDARFDNIPISPGAAVTPIAPPTVGEPAVEGTSDDSGEKTVSEASSPGAEEVSTTYVTENNDSFWNISKRHYSGEGRFFKALYYHNRYRIVRPDQISAGVELEIPPLAELQRMYPDLCGVGRSR